MELESYFDFVNDTAIRLKGTRLGIETVIVDYLAGASPEETVLRFQTLSLEQVHATITYFLANRASVDAYVQRVETEQMQRMGSTTGIAFRIRQIVARTFDKTEKRSPQ